MRLSELKARAIRVGYKNIIPTIPIFKKEKPEVHSSQMVGFNKRLYNWERGLIQFENPGGLPQPEPEVSTELLNGVKILN